MASGWHVWWCFGDCHIISALLNVGSDCFSVFLHVCVIVVCGCLFECSSLCPESSPGALWFHPLAILVFFYLFFFKRGLAISEVVCMLELA